MPFNQSEINEITSELDRIENEAVLRAERSVVRGLRAIEREMVANIDQFQETDGLIRATPENLQAATNFTSSFLPALTQIAEAQKSEVLSRLTDITARMDDMLRATGFRPDPSGARVDENVVSAFLNLDLSRFNGGANATAQVLSDMIFQQLSIGVDRQQFIRQIQNLVGGGVDAGGLPLSRHAGTWVRTAISTFEGQIVQQSTDPEEIGGWFYQGPFDGKNRDFCRARAGRFFRDADIREDIASQGPAGANLTRPGGFNCRHRLLPVSEERFQRAVQQGRVDTR